MQNLIVFQTVLNSDGEFGFEWQKKLKSKANFILGHEFTFHKIKVFLMKNSASVKVEEEMEQDAEYNSLSNCHRFRWRIWV